KWEDILKPEFEKKVAIRGQGESFCETTLLTIYKQFGIEGIRKLGKAVKYGWHPSQMAKTAGSGSEESPAVSVMPYFFTRTIKYKQNVEVVWLEDGAIVSPVTMLVKADKAEELKDVTRFFTGTYAGKISASASFPVLHPDVDNKIPENVSLNWLGWDFIKQNDIERLIRELTSEFLVTFKET
ncbi:MAG TPA: ABC transporter substrate-binding protein, partial [Clostridia bacterium]